jgi:hypothetical protein
MTVATLQNIYGGVTSDSTNIASRLLLLGSSVQLQKVWGPVTISRRIVKCFSELLRSEGDRLFALIDKERQKDIAYTSRSSLTSAEGDLDCILRYEAHLSREFDRTFNQFERLQSARHISSTD